MTELCLQALPRQAYGLVGGAGASAPETVQPCRTNLRQDPRFGPLFEAHGDFYRDPDRGFVIDPREYLQIVGGMERRIGQRLVGVFHSHRCLDARPSALDRDFHFDPSLVCYIVSVRRPSEPDVRAYHIEGGRFHEIPIEIVRMARRTERSAVV